MTKLQPRLVHGPYHAPECAAGDTLTDVLRGPLEVGGFTNGLIRWPLGKGMYASRLIICGDLMKALQTESAAAIAFGWGVSGDWAVSMRRHLGLPEPKVVPEARDITPLKRRQIEKLLAAGMPVAGVAETVRVPSSLVRKIRETL